MRELRAEVQYADAPVSTVADSMTDRLDTEAITARLKNATDYTGPIGDRVDFKAALLHAEFHAYAPGDIAALLAEVARLRAALTDLHAVARALIDETRPAGDGVTDDTEKIKAHAKGEYTFGWLAGQALVSAMNRARAALQAVEETP
jgi:hypothetical protein